MRIAPSLMAPLLIVLVGSVLSPTTVRTEMFVFRDERGILHFSNVPDDSNWVPLDVPPSRRSRSLKHLGTPAYPFAHIVGVQAIQHGIDAALIRAIIKVESDFDPRARSSKGAVGLMQILPETAQRYGEFNLYEPDQNIRVGARHLKLLLARFRNDLRLALAAYNAGAAAVTRHGGVPPFPETIEYIGRVLRQFQGYRGRPDRVGAQGPS